MCGWSQNIFESPLLRSSVEVSAIGFNTEELSKIIPCCFLPPHNTFEIVRETGKDTIRLAARSKKR